MSCFVSGEDHFTGLLATVAPIHGVRLYVFLGLPGDGMEGEQQGKELERKRKKSYIRIRENKNGEELWVNIIYVHKLIDFISFISAHKLSSYHNVRVLVGV